MDAISTAIAAFQGRKPHTSVQKKKRRVERCIKRRIFASHRQSERERRRRERKERDEAIIRDHQDCLNQQASISAIVYDSLDDDWMRIAERAAEVICHA